MSELPKNATIVTACSHGVRCGAPMPRPPSRRPRVSPCVFFFALDIHSLLQNIFHIKCSHCAVQRNSGPGDRRLPPPPSTPEILEA
jgi:hypothetical protein